MLLFSLLLLHRYAYVMTLTYLFRRFAQKIPKIRCRFFRKYLDRIMEETLSWRFSGLIYTLSTSLEIMHDIRSGYHYVSEEHKNATDIRFDNKCICRCLSWSIWIRPTPRVIRPDPTQNMLANLMTQPDPWQHDNQSLKYTKGI